MSKVIHSQGRELIFNVYKYMQEEKERQELTVPLNNLQERVAAATGVSLSTLKRIVKEGMKLTPATKFTSPRKSVAKSSKCSVVDIWEENVVQRIEAEYMEREHIIDAVEDLIIPINQSGGEESESSLWSDSDDEDDNLGCKSLDT
ncbi:hypothetical protein FQA39_LY11028 [Lamprigera yunnana]|nr:hypothetical protein FQA39_LY11028 [Lamprigera yunnana]